MPTNRNSTAMTTSPTSTPPPVTTNNSKHKEENLLARICTILTQQGKKANAGIYIY